MTRAHQHIIAAQPPPGSLIASYTARGDAYTDAFVAHVSGQVGLETFVSAFYASPLFAAERAVLRVAGHPSTRADIADLAAGRLETFAAWTVETRRETEILLCDVSGRTRSWLAVEPDDGGGTGLWFGSAVVPAAGREAGGLGLPFTLILGPHRAYSRALLRAALRNLSV